jgi:hypothetical protein
MPKIGRNNPCPCGSGKKYKRCHGSWESLDNIERETHVTMKARIAAQHLQRERQQGLGKPIISAEAFGQRFVAVKNRLLHSQTWRTFHDFLGDYIKIAMGPDWGNAEIAKPLKQRHPILVWYHLMCEYQQRFIAEEGKVHSAPMTGAMAAYMHLSYDLYALDHNAELQEKLINRLRNHDNFPGARYEVFVAAMLIRAGFEIEFENEDDRSTSHCEFTATFTRTGKRFSVEAKHRAGYKFRLGQKLNRALAKQANYTRIVFIDINIPDDAIETDISAHLISSLADLRAFEGRIINGQPLPNAYLFVTNTPWHHHLDIESIRCSSVADGFQIPDFKHDFTFPSLREAIDARERHIEMHELLFSMRDHADIPSTFDGEIAEFAFGEGPPRLLIGQRYLIKGNDGSKRPGLLTTATVTESECTVYCALSFDDGTSGIYTWPLSDVEMAAWRKHPDTFFGEVGQRTSTANTPLELYDFFLNSYRQTPRERLLELMAGSPDFKEISKIDQPTLASIYAERCVNGAMLAQSRDF